ncbi:MAG: Quinone-reactive Ni/Fe-hydrogenase B-type cytochrome subunit [Deltaproteobacteria bacterium ADurb.Bin026]|nr:MAG: Quinone-reactive Ni/Fe-hydrogenase B-type cytochrome subunit [Deltaproteobacteria bacterium ADurb.Bin026]HPH42534.1 cytochrome b/b6 domain-containing protein [Syntrophorhabdaceae bacterium]HQI55508.1 cytochrome b/b6 domain-containing protein [Syntrophorhabdaceae bacterium]
MSGIYLHPLPIRIWHWTNAFIVFVLIITGIQLRTPSINIIQDYRTVVLLHKYFGFAMTASFLFWFFYYIITGGLIKYYLLRIKDIKGMPLQVLYYVFFIFNGKKNPFYPSTDNKFNPMQKLAYSSVMFVFTPLIIITGILFSDITYFFSWIKTIGGLRILDAIHVATAYIFVLYLVVHIYMATLGEKPHSHVKGMITGYEE